MGSLSNIHFAYIAGFLDGDGSLMLQLKKRGDRSIGYRFMATICFYQDTRHEQPLRWIKKILSIGYLSRRNDGMTELRINGFDQIRTILKKLLPFIKFKRRQALLLYKATRLFLNTRGRLTQNQLVRTIDYLIAIQNENYVTKRKKSKEELLRMLGLTP